MILCRHCRKRKANRPRWLCWSCYYRPEVCNRYKPKCPTSADPAGNPGVRLPDDPTDTLPGSKERVAVLMQRAERGESLHHPLDRRIDRV